MSLSKIIVSKQVHFKLKFKAIDLLNTGDRTITKELASRFTMIIVGILKQVLTTKATLRDKDIKPRLRDKLK